MGSISAVDQKTGRKCFLDDPDDLKADERSFLSSIYTAAAPTVYGNTSISRLMITKTNTVSLSRRPLPPLKSQCAIGLLKLTTSI